MTISELIVVMAISGTLWGISTITLAKPQQKANVDSVVNTLIADIRTQQTKAMSGDITSDYTIHFEEDSYLLDNFTIDLDQNIRISNITLNGGDLVFEKGSGEVNFVAGQNSLTVSNTLSGEVAVITINKYGVTSKN